MHKSLIAALIFTGTILAGCSHSQKISRTSPAHKQIIVDEYSVLDDGKTKPISDRELHRKLEDARQSYAQAMRLSDQGKTSQASRFFERALATLNDLVTYPNISVNDEFATLSENVMRDYEDRISIDSMDANSNFFVLRDKMMQEIGTIPVQRRDYPTADPATTASFQIPLTDNLPVQQCISFFTSDRGRKFFSRWLERSGRFFPVYDKVIKEEGAPQELRYLSMIESGLNATAVSRAKAVGLWQFMASTGSLYGLRINWWVDERRDPEKATHAAARYLMDLYEDLGDWHLALASYNCGPGRVKSAIAKAGSRDYWQVRNYLPGETQKYVPLYIAAAKIASNPEAYGFTNLNYDKPDDYKTLPMDFSYEFPKIAQMLELSTEDLRTLNPELLHGRVPPGQVQYQLRIPKNTPDDLIASFKQQADSIRANLSWLTHKVAKGETVVTIAKKYNVQSSDIFAYNSVKPGGALSKGTSLRIPVLKNATLAVSTDSVASGRSDDDNESDFPTASAGTSPSARRSVRSTSTSPDGVMREIPVPAEAVKPDTSDQSRLIRKQSPNTLSGLRRNEIRSTNDTLKSDNARLAGFRPSETTYAAKTAPVLRKTVAHRKPTKSPVHLASRRNSIREDRQGRSDRGYFVRASYHPNRRGILPERVHQIRKGETLSQFASRYGVSQNDLRKWNPHSVKRNKVLYGTSLKLKGDAAVREARIVSNERASKRAASLKRMNKKGHATVARSRNAGRVAVKHNVIKRQATGGSAKKVVKHHR